MEVSEQRRRRSKGTGKGGSRQAAGRHFGSRHSSRNLAQPIIVYVTGPARIQEDRRRWRLTVHMRAEDQTVWMAGQANGRAQLADQVLAPPARIPRCASALATVVSHALSEKQPARALIEKSGAETSHGQVPVGASIARTPRCEVRLVVQLRGRDRHQTRGLSVKRGGARPRSNVGHGHLHRPQ